MNRVVVAMLALMRAHNSVYVIDVRSPGQYESGHIPGAVLIPLELLNGSLLKLSRVRKPIIAYCLLSVTE